MVNKVLCVVNSSELSVHILMVHFLISAISADENAGRDSAERNYQLNHIQKVLSAGCCIFSVSDAFSASPRVFVTRLNLFSCLVQTAR